MTNTNEKTGIAFGIITANSLDSDVVNSLMFVHGINHTEQDALKEGKIEFLQAQLSEDDFDELDESDYDSKIDELDPLFEDHFWLQSGDYDEPQISGEYEGVKYETCWLGGALNFVIFESPVVTYKANRGSLCVPNMGVLDSLDGDYQCYDVPCDWRNQD